MTTSTASHLNGHTRHSNTFNQHSGICHRVGCYLETFNNTSHYFVAIHPELNSLPAIQTQQRLEIRWQSLTVNLNATSQKIVIYNQISSDPSLVFGRKYIQAAPDVMSFSIAWRTPSPLMLLSCTEFSFPWSKKRMKKLSLTDQAKHCTCYGINEASPYREKNVNSISTQDLSNKSNTRLGLITFSAPRKLKIQHAAEHF